MEYPLNESVWGRGWSDTKTVWTSWQFVLLDAVAGIMIGGVFEWYWGLAIVIFGMFCIWMGATFRAPYKQRNEARALLLAKPKPIPLQNKVALIRAIGKIRQESLDLMDAQQQLDQDNHPYSIDSYAMSNRDKAYREYKQAMDELHCEMLVAGDVFNNTLESLTTFRGFQVLCNTAKPVQIGGDKPLVLSGLDFAARLGERVDKTIREINEISQ